MSDVGERKLTTQHATTNDPVRFVVEGERAQKISEALPPDLKGMYLTAWHDAIGAAMDDCGWSYDETPNVDSAVVERVRTGRPRVIHSELIGEQLARAVRSVDRILDTIVVGDVEVSAAVTKARQESPVAFEWRITENYKVPGAETVSTRQLLSSSYIDVTTADAATAVV